MGRNKIKIKKIENDRQKTVTFTRRRSGLIKKAHELSVLCDCRVALLIFDAKDNCHLYSSTQPADELLGKFYRRDFGASEARFRPIPGVSRPRVAVINEYKVNAEGEGSEDITVRHQKHFQNMLNPSGISPETFSPLGANKPLQMMLQPNAVQGSSTLATFSMAPTSEFPAQPQAGPSGFGFHEPEYSPSAAPQPSPFTKESAMDTPLTVVNAAATETGEKNDTKLLTDAFSHNNLPETSRFERPHQLRYLMDPLMTPQTSENAPLLISSGLKRNESESLPSPAHETPSSIHASPNTRPKASLQHVDSRENFDMFATPQTSTVPGVPFSFSGYLNNSHSDLTNTYRSQKGKWGGEY